jgi:hypothetical protein
MAVDQSAKPSTEHSAYARARVRDIAQRSITRSEGSAVATFNRWQISPVVVLDSQLSAMKRWLSIDSVEAATEEPMSQVKVR